jgi:CobQ-like glutamine amidotransferase family enzyme
MSTDIKIEVLYGEFANLFGELQNVNYLKRCIPDAEMIYTELHDKPAFVDGGVTLVYMGAMTERQQELVIDALTPYKEAIEKQIEAGTIFLFTGNALEIMEAYIENEDGSRITGLGIFDTYAKRDMMHRYNSMILGSFEGIKLVGFKAQFSHSYGDNSSCYFYDVVRGDGLYPGIKTEGLRRNNFFGTYTVGPFLIYNPLFVKYLMSLMGIENPTLAYEKDIMKAYEKRLAEFENENTKYLQ